MSVQNIQKVNNLEFNTDFPGWLSKFIMIYFHSRNRSTQISRKGTFLSVKQIDKVPRDIDTASSGKLFSTNGT